MAVSELPSPNKGSLSGWRIWAARAHLAIAVLFVACVAIQTFLIGLVLFNEGDIALHRGFGVLTLLVAILVPVSAGVANAPSGQVQRSAGLLGLTFLQMLLASTKWSGPSVIGALHPVGALLVFGLGVIVARGAWMFVAHGAVEERSVAAAEVESRPSRLTGG